MTLGPGTRIGVYEINALLGAGGMGQVYRATDTTLGRQVAIKILPDAFAADPERVGRFEREAKTLASLNHPHIAAIYGFEKSEATHALVMELVEGEDLSAHIARGPIPFAEALNIARQVAEALEAAHAQGIIHRDLKPANIRLKGAWGPTPTRREDGRLEPALSASDVAGCTVKVLDFGLAKAVAEDGGPGTADLVNSPTLTARATQMGVILGTAAYMAPEQAKGRTVDRRADVWAFGCVLYEMLTARRAFEGEDITDTLAAVVRGEPDWTRLPPGLPPAVRVLLERCLIKERADRLDMSVVRFLLSDTAKTLSGAQALAGGSAPAAAPKRRISPIVLIAATAALAIAATYGVMQWVQPGAVTFTGAGGLAHVSIAMSEGDEVGAPFLRPIAVSEDGTRVAYVRLRDGKTKISVRTLSEAAARALDGTDGGVSPFFSPDGRWIGFFAGEKLKKIAVGGAALQTLADAPAPRGGSWSTDGYIYFAPTNTGAIWRVPQDGGGPAVEVTRKDPAAGEISHRWPHAIAGTNTLLFGVWTGPGDGEQSIARQTIDTPGHRVLVRGANAPWYAAAPGVLIYSHLGELFAVTWRSPQTDIDQAVPVALPEQTSDSGGNEGAGNYAVSGEGTLAYIAGGRGRDAKRLVWIDRAGRIEPTAWPERVYESATISPDGTRAIVQIREATTTLWMADLARHTLAPIGNSPGSSQAPLWTVDGTRVIYRATRKGLRNLYWRAADGSGDEEPLTSKPDVNQTPTSVSPDGRWLVFSENGAKEGVGLWVMRLQGDRAARPVFRTSGGESDGQISPDGKWIAFQAPVSSRQEVYVAPFPGPGPRQQISNEGGTEPLWSRDGRELFFQSGARSMGISVTAGPAFSASAPRVVHEGHFLPSTTSNTSYSMTRDGQRFLRIQQVDPERNYARVAGAELDGRAEAAGADEVTSRPSEALAVVVTDPSPAWTSLAIIGLLSSDMGQAGWDGGKLCAGDRPCRVR